MDSLTDSYSPLEMEEALEKLPCGSNALDAAYGQAMERFKDQNKNATDLAYEALSWVTYAERLLTVAEIQYALAINNGAEEFNKRCIKSIEGILSVCAGLVIVDAATQTNRLAHYTTQDYFK